ncbi:MAG: cobalt transporter [Rhodospirillales bacterium]|nr:cobalt transporter [Rhodospirillales bacterium]
MFRQIVLTALVAGGLAGAIAFGAHTLKAVPLIAQAEVYEKATPASSPTPPHAHAQAADTPAHDAWEPEDGIERALYTLLADLVTGIGFAFVLVGAIQVRGRAIDATQGLMWGLAGFATFSAAPALGLPPELPGMAGDGLVERQIWWLATAFATAAGLGLFAFAAPLPLKVAGVALALLPHVIGAPVHPAEAGPLPAALAAEFAAVSLVTAGMFWAVLGGLTGYFLPRFARPQPLAD